MMPALLRSNPPPSNPLLVGRIIKTLLPPLASLLSSDTGATRPQVTTSTPGGKIGRRRAQNFESDDMFKISRDKLCGGKAEEEHVIGILDGAHTFFISIWIDDS